MKTALLGTILPTMEDLRRSEVQSAREVKLKSAIAETDPRLAGCERRVVGGELRYYDTTDQYAIVSRQHKVIWFAVRPDGDYRI